MTQNRHSGQAGRNRVLEMLAILQIGLCGRCGRARYTTRRTARHAARIAAPGIRLRAYRCGDAWHLTTPPGRRQFIAPPVTVPPIHSRNRLDLRGRGERSCQVPHSSWCGRRTWQRPQAMNAPSPRGRR
ncbi:hypothetical protein GCM10009735_84690 [Actinomadura chokoriensis]